MLARAGLIGILAISSRHQVAPPGAARRGSAPIRSRSAFRPTARPLLIDIGISALMFTDLASRVRRNESLPDGCAIDAAGKPTRDPAAAMQPPDIGAERRRDPVAPAQAPGRVSWRRPGCGSRRSPMSRDHCGARNEDAVPATSTRLLASAGLARDPDDVDRRHRSGSDLVISMSFREGCRFDQPRCRALALAPHRRCPD